MKSRAAAPLKVMSIKSLTAEPSVSLELTNSRSSALLTRRANQGAAVSLTNPQIHPNTLLQEQSLGVRALSPPNLSPQDVPTPTTESKKVPLSHGDMLPLLPLLQDP